MERFYDKKMNRLVYVGRAAETSAWDDLWRSEHFGQQITRPRNWFVVGMTRRHLPAGARVLDGGCGRGDKVYSLRRAGFDSWGVDTAQETVRAIHHHVPSLPVIRADVRRLPFASGSFDGYWSLGVIEHFFNGYGRVLREIRRVLSPKGFLFLSFPSLSPLRRARIRRGAYPLFDGGKSKPPKFWQFALDTESVAETFRKGGFDLVQRYGRGGMIGVREELPRTGTAIQYIEDRQSFPPFRAMFVAGNLVLSPIAYHTSVLVMHKR